MYSVELINIKAKATIYTCLWLFCFSCNSSFTESDLESVKASIDTIKIHIPNYTSATLIRPEIWDNEQGEFLAVYNYLDHSILIFDLVAKEFLKQIKLQHEGPDFVTRVQDLVSLLNNQFLIIGDRYLTKIDISGKVISRIEINTNNSPLSGIDFNLSRLLFDKHRGPSDLERYAMFYAEIYNFGQTFKELYLAKIDLNELTVDTFSVLKNQEEYRDLGAYNSLRGLDYSLIDGIMFLSFKTSPHVFERVSQNEKLFLEPSIFSPHLNETASVTNGKTSLEDKLKHEQASPRYFPIHFDRHSGLYFRIHKHAIDVNSKEEDYFIQTFSAEGQFLHNIKLPKGYYISPICSKEGVMFMAYNKHDSTLELLRYELSD